jgi:hypothetical protein
MAKSHAARRWIAQLAPYLIAAVALIWVLRRYSYHDLEDAIRRAQVGWFLAFSAVMLTLNCAADVFAMQRVFAWFAVRVPFRQLFVLRASTYLVAFINYTVGQAAIIGYLNRGRGIRLKRAGGIILFIIGVNVGTLFLLASAGASQARGNLAVLHYIPLACAVGVVTYGGLLLWKPAVLARRTALAPLFEMGISGHLKGVVVRLPHVAVLMVWHFVSLRLFNIEITPTAALLYLPAYFAAVTLPINFNGLGAAQAVAIAFFSPFAHAPNPEAQGAAVVTYSIATAVVSAVFQIMLGLVFVRRGMNLTKLAAAATVEEREATAAAVPEPEAG